MKKMLVTLAVCLVCSVAGAATNGFYDSSVTYSMTGTVLNISLMGRPVNPPVLQSIMLSTSASVSNRVVISLLRGVSTFVLWDSQDFVGTTASWYADNAVKLSESDTVRVTKSATNAASVIANWK